MVFLIIFLELNQRNWATHYLIIMQWFEGFGTSKPSEIVAFLADNNGYPEGTMIERSIAALR